MYLPMVSIDEFWLACENADLDLVKRWLDLRGLIRTMSVDYTMYNQRTRRLLDLVMVQSKGNAICGALLLAIWSENLTLLRILLKRSVCREVLADQRRRFLAEASVAGDRRIYDLVSCGRYSRLRALFWSRSSSGKLRRDAATSSAEISSDSIVPHTTVPR